MTHRFPTLTLWRAMIALGVVALATLAGVVGVQEARATLDVPQILVYQGRLTDEDRITVADGSYSMKFSLYTASSGGTPVWTAAGTVGTPTAVSVTVTDGIFTYNLGSGANAFDDELFEDNATLYLGVTIGSDSEMTPRRQLGSAAYAMHAGDSDLLDDLNTSDAGCNSACVPVTTVNGNFVITGDPQSTAIGGGSVYINPASAAADEMLFGVALGGNARFSVDEDGDVDIEHHMALGASASVSTTSALVIAQDYGATGSTYNLINIDSTFEDAGNPNTNLRGARVALTVDAGAGNDIQNLVGYQTVLDHNGGGATDAMIGAQLSLLTSGGTVTDADGIVASISTDNAAGTITNARGIQATVTQVTGTITTGFGGDFSTSGTMTTSYGVYASADATATNNYGLYGKATNGTTDYAIYTADGRVQIEGDATATAPTVATGDGELFVVGDIETDANLVAGGRLAIGTTPTTSDLGVLSQTLALGTAGSYSDLKLSMTTTGDGNSLATYADVYGGMTSLTVTDGGGTGQVRTLVGSQTRLIHQGAGTTDSFIGAQVSLDGTAGALAKGVGVDVSLAATAMTVIDSLGLQVDVNTGGVDTALYVARGYVHVDTAVYGSKTSPTFGAVGADGTMFVKNDVEIYDGALCVGDLGDCAGSGSVDGTIYATNVTVQPNDLAEMFPSLQFLTAGEIVSVSSDNSEYVGRTTAGGIIIGAVSTKPGLTLGRETTNDNHYPVALTGRTPVKVSSENGAIAIGDRIAVSSFAGIGMKATTAGEVVGIAMEGFDGNGTGAVMTFIQPHFWDGVAMVESVTEQEPEPIVQPDRVLVMEDGFIKNIMGLSSGGWSVDFDGAFVTEGSYGVLIRGNGGADVTVYSTLSTQQLVILTGTIKMEGKMAEVKFEDVDPLFNDVIAPAAPIVVTATMSNGSGTVSVRRKDTNGFELWRESGTGDEVDWIAMAYRVGKVPEEDEEMVEEEVVEEIVEEPVEGEVVEEVIEGADDSTDVTDSTDEPVEEEPVIEEPVEESPVEETIEEDPVIPSEAEGSLPDESEDVVEEVIADTSNTTDVTDATETPIEEPVIEEPATPNEIP